MLRDLKSSPPASDWRPRFWNGWEDMAIMALMTQKQSLWVTPARDCCRKKIRDSVLSFVQAGLLLHTRDFETVGFFRAVED
jgi:hypothetical protein